MKKIINIFLISLILIASLITSCTKDVLDKVPLDIISDNVVWNDPVFIDAYFTECYAETYVFSNVSVDNGWDHLWYGDAGPAPMFVNDVSEGDWN